MASERQEIKKLFEELCKQRTQTFPQSREPLEAPLEPGVYIICKGINVLHVGRTSRAKYGIYQRLYNHLHGASSFTDKYLKGNGEALRKGHTFQYLIVKDDRLRALLEAYAIGRLCPKHIGLGVKAKR